MIIDMVTGHETFTNPSVSTRLNCFYQKTKEDDPVSVYTAMKDPKSGISQLRRDFTQASDYNRHHGDWCHTRFEVPDCSFLTVNIEKKIGSNIFAISRLRYS